MKKIAIITARSGSKGLPNKNILMLGDKPLIAYTIEAAKKSELFDRVIVSTDSLEYEKISEKYGAEVFIRGEELSNDKASSFMVIKDVLERVTEVYDYFVLLQPTSPFRTEKHIKASITNFEKQYEKFDFSISMQKSEKTAKLIAPLEEDYSLKNYNMDFSNYARQKYDEYYPNGAIFIGKIKEYLKQKHFFGERSLAYIMNKEDSLDIDDSLDFEIAIFTLMKKNKENILLQNIKNRINEKLANFKLKRDIALIGHSLFDNWNIEKFKNYSVNNLGIRGINTIQYQELILNEHLIQNLPNYVFIILGTNDIVDKSLSFQDIINNINKLIGDLYKINSQTKIFFIEIPTVFHRVDKKKNKILELNSFIKKNLNLRVDYVEINKYMSDEFGNLNLEYTYDGLHFNEKGYKQFQYGLEKEIDI